MKKSIKFISLFILSLVMIFMGKVDVFASDNSVNSFVANSYAISSKPLGLSSFNISVKKTSDGKYIYCYDVNDVVPNGITYSKKEEITNNVLRYIVSTGLSDKTDSEFFATQSAVWIYLLDNGMMSDTTYKYISNIKKAIDSSSYKNDSVAKDIKNLLSDAKTASYVDYSLDIANSKLVFTLSGNEYVSDYVKVNTNVSEWNVTFKNAPVGTTYVKDSNGFTIHVPQSSIIEGSTISLSAIVTSSTQTIYHVYKYVASDSRYQDMLLASTEEKVLSDSISGSITREVKELEPTVIIISKKDITNNKELPGATLVVRNAKGKEIDRWISTSEPHTINNLSVGAYTLEEISQPDGYVLSSEKITFTVEKDGKVKNVTMYNTPEEVKETLVVISKKDITTKEELPGATLIVSDSLGKEIDRWVSANEPHTIKNLEVGTYTLEEVSQPDGYVLNSEKITFTVTNDGTITEVVMFNTPTSTDIVIPSTGMNSSIIIYIVGGMIVLIGSVLIYKNVKKEQ